MNDKGDSKYIINVEMNKYIFFPHDTIDGIIKLKPSDTLINKIISEDISITFTLKEAISYYCEELDYTYETISHFKNHRLYDIKEESITYDYLKGYSFAYGLNIPFKFQIPKMEMNNNLYPSFRFIETNFQCYVTHQLIIEIKNKSNKLYVDIFIKKPKNNNGSNSVTIFKDEVIKKYFIMNKGRLSYYIETENSCSYVDPLPITIHLDKTDLKNIKLKTIELSVINNISIKEINFTHQRKISEKVIEIPENLDNNIIKDCIALNKNDFSEIPQNEIRNLIYDNIDNESIKIIQKYNCPPPIDNIFFNCLYNLKIELIFEENFIQKRIIDITIDYYDGEYKNDNIELKMEETPPIIDQVKNDSNTSQKEQKLLNDDFTLLTKEDFINLIDGKK